MSTIVNAAGGDYTGLPTQPVQYRGRRQHTGLDWDQLTDNYTSRGGQVDASVWSKRNVQLVPGTAGSSSAAVHTFSADEDYEEHAEHLEGRR